MRRRALSAPGSRALDPNQHEPCSDRPGDDIDIRLVRPVQIYLELRRLGVAPSPSIERTWQAFFEAADPVVLAAARAGRRIRSDLDDDKQEAWREIIAGLPSYRHDPSRGRLCDWVYVLSRRSCVRMARRRRYRPIEPLPPGADDDLVGHDSAPWSAIERAERRGQVGRGLVAFRDHAGRAEFLAVLLHWVGGRPTEEVATRLVLTTGQVRGLLARARPRLRACLDSKMID